jgi:hypothetical protein
MFSKGQKFKPSASRENEIDRLLRDTRSGSATFSRPGSYAALPGQILAKNETGADLAACKIAQYNSNPTCYNNSDGTSVDWDTRKGYLSLQPNANLNSNDSFSVYPNGFAVTVEPIKQNEFGVVAVSGIALVDATFSAGAYLRPSTGGAVRSNWGFARIILNNAAVNQCVINLDDSQLIALYEITGAWSSSEANCKIDPPGGYTTKVVDEHNIAQWQTTGDRGFAMWSGVEWQVMIPFCDVADQP